MFTYRSGTSPRRRQTTGERTARSFLIIAAVLMFGAGRALAREADPRKALAYELVDLNKVAEFK
ncbi:MAG TPA: hypothetical protein VMQ11_09715 [Alphaproteobacteria bacterium]|nr:hypothetical protein [Alphaproteobacteria bacterium]